ncbi:hypothetical protein DMENIID0001_031030 [Sergentomyia squamirostris]
MAKCEVKFDNNPSGIYSTGQTVSGQVELTIPKVKTVKVVTLNIVGYAKCLWEEPELRVRSYGYNSRIYKGREDYLSFSMNLVEPEKEEKTVDLAPGTHFYTFTYDLPDDIPTSFEGTNGYIRYYVIIVFERPWKFDQKFKTSFTVLKQVDLTIDANILSLPSQGAVDQNLSFGPFKNGPVSIIGNTPQTGYVSGQTVTVNAEIENASTAKLNEIRFYLQQIVRYTSLKPKVKTKEKAVTVAEARVACLDQVQQTKKFVQYLQIPPLPPTCTSLSKVITISYEVRVEARVSGLYRNPNVQIPITLGSVPLNNVCSIPNSSISMVESTVNPDDEPRDERDIPPPSYEECAFGAAQLRDDEDDENTVMSCRNYAPRYPVYNCRE